ncbi:YunC family protein [Chitiniphilus purpureus]|uniref:YunC family protein n=1 Tax=Chitiniphilus purpureus TaxID=2981137 RepID=A0ABY6DV81_9NEIS|nr:YunC family protein [Chitiniphilus sp. CD1]UXY16971.1 YunC family protein [Chitiniphilus sp. CD1]
MDAGAIQDQIQIHAEAEVDQFEYLNYGALARPLLIIKGKKGFLGCGYINVETCNKTSEACAIVSGVNTFDDMRKAKVVAVSVKARELGVVEGELGAAALAKLR